MSEGDETVVVTLLDDVRYNLGSSTVRQRSPSPIRRCRSCRVSAFDPDAAEAGLETGAFRFTRTGDLSVALTVSYTRSGTATNGTDYANIGGTVTFNAGQATTDRIVVPVNDAVVEGPETVIVTLTDGANYDLGAGTSATVTIADQPVPTISVAGHRRLGERGGGHRSLPVHAHRRHRRFSLAFTVARGGTATNSSDYSNISTTLTFLAGQATLDRTLVPVNDALIEGTETVSLTVVDGANYDLGTPVTGSIDILDQPIPIVTIAGRGSEPRRRRGPDPGVFRFTRVGDVSLALTVNYVRTGTASSQRLRELRPVRSRSRPERRRWTG